jgi:integrase
MRWDELDLARGVWTIPAGKAKNKNRLQLPLNSAVLRLLTDRSGESSDYVFPGKAGHVQDIRKAYQKVLTAAGIEDLTLHDLRRTFASWAAMEGVDLPTLGRLTGHKDLKTLQKVYTHSELEHAREATAAVATKMLSAANGDVVDEDEVTQLRRRVAELEQENADLREQLGVTA